MISAALRTMPSPQRLRTASGGGKAPPRRPAGLMTDFPEMPYWEDLAKRYHVALPRVTQHLTEALMTAFLKSLGKSVPKYKKATGESDLSEFGKLNPSWPAKAWAGVVLEMIDGGSL